MNESIFDFHLWVTSDIMHKIAFPENFPEMVFLSFKNESHLNYPENLHAIEPNMNLHVGKILNFVGNMTFSIRLSINV